MRLSRRSTALGATVAAIGLLPVVVTITADATTDELLSNGRPVAASSALSAAFAPAKAVDGSGRTRWAAAGAGTQWLRVDLGSLQPVNRVRIVWAPDYPKSYQVQVSTDGASWGNVHTTRSGNGGTDDLTRLAGIGRYVRVLTTRRGAGTSLWELQVYGPGRRPVPASPVPASPGAAGLDDPAKKELAMQLVASAENSTVNWQDQYGYLEDLDDGRGYTGGIIGFCSGTSDMVAVVAEYVRRKPDNVLLEFLPALREVNGSDSHEGLDPGFAAAWRSAAEDPDFQQVQRDERDRIYFNPAVALGKADGLRALGQFLYYDAAVVHGPNGMYRVRSAALRAVRSPAQGGDEATYLNAYLDARAAEMRTEAAHTDTSRVDTAQRVFLQANNLDLAAPLTWQVYGDTYAVG